MNKDKKPLSETHPDLAKEAFGWDPKTVTRGSNKKYKWACPKGHIYEMSPHMRSGQNQRCPFCSGKIVLQGFNDLATTHPDFASEADGWDPKNVSAGSHIVQNWKCKEGHKFRVNPNQRTSRKSN